MGGSSSWALKEGAYATDCSVRAGEELGFCVSSSVIRQRVFVFRLDVVRELVASVDVDVGLQKVVGPRPYADGFGWVRNLTLRTTPQWRSGIYVAQFQTGLGVKEAPFVVRRAPRDHDKPGSGAPMLWVLADATWQTYNVAGGKSLYDYQSTDGFGSEKLTFDRPYAMDGAGKLVIWDQFWANFLASEGFTDLDCCTQFDVASGRQSLDGYRCMLRTGHDEYWSADEVQAVQRFVDHGGNLAFFSGNNVHWQIRYGEGGRTLTCHRHPYLKKRAQAMGVPKASLADPLARDDPERATTLWARLPGHAGTVRQRLTGASWTGMVNVPWDDGSAAAWPEAPAKDGRLLGPAGGHGSWTVEQPEHWIFEGSSLKKGEAFGLRETIVGTEADGCDTTIARVEEETLDSRDRQRHRQLVERLVPSGKDGVDPEQWEILASCTAAFISETTGPLDSLYQTGTATLLYHEGGPGGERGGSGSIFNCATLDWSHGLRSSAETATITRNVLRRFTAATAAARS